MKIRLSVILIFVSNFLFCQDSIVKPNRFSIKITPLALIDVFGGNSYRIGSEFKIKNSVSASLEYGKYFSYNSKGFFKPLRISTKGNIIRAEIKYYS